VSAIVSAVRARVILARRCGRVTGAVWRFARAVCPKWLLPVLVACAFIPGPLDELAVLAVVLVPVLRSRHKRAQLASDVSAAWRGKVTAK